MEDISLLDTVRLYIDATIAIAIMATLGVISGFVAAAVTGDRTLVILAGIAGFVLAGVVLIARLWRTTQKPVLPMDPAA